jgi:hypothetical protein
VQIPLAVVLVVVVGPVNHGIGLWRGFDVVVGGVVGVTVALLWPEQPRYTPAFEAQRSWRDALSKQLCDVAIELRRPPQLLRDDERHDFVQGSRQLHGYAARGRQRVEEAEESLYFNLRAGRVREQTGALVGQQRWLVRLTLHIRSLSYAVDRLYDRAVPPMLDRVALARLLDGLATQIPHAPVPADDLAAQRLQATIATLVSEVATSPGATVRALDSVGILARLEQLRDDLVDHVDEDPDSDR